MSNNTIATLKLPDAPLHPHKANPTLDLFDHPERILITPSVFKRLQLFLEFSRGPVAFAGTVTFTGAGHYLIDNVFVLEQTTSENPNLAVTLDGVDALEDELKTRGSDADELIDRLAFFGITNPKREAAVHQDDPVMLSLGSAKRPWAIKATVTGGGTISFDLFDYERGFIMVDAPWAVHDPIRGLVLSEEGINNDLLNDTGLAGAHRPLRAFREMPTKLKPSNELRAEVKAEFGRKVTSTQAAGAPVSLVGPLPHVASTYIKTMQKAPTVVISAEAYMRMQLYIDLCPLEVGWLGTVKLSPKGHFFIDNVFLINQDVSAVQTELSTEGQNDLTVELAELGDVGVDMMNRMRFWGHSHVRMRVMPSMTDDETMHKQFGEQLVPFAIRGIFNKIGHGKIDVYRYDLGFRMLDVPWVVYHREKGAVLRSDTPPGDLPPELVPSDELKAQVAQEYKEKVRLPGPKK